MQLTEARVFLRVDFSYLEDGVRVFEEVKGFETEGWRIKRALWKVYGPGELRVMKRAPGGAIRMAECIRPTELEG